MTTTLLNKIVVVRSGFLFHSPLLMLLRPFEGHHHLSLLGTVECRQGSSTPNLANLGIFPSGKLSQVTY